MKRFLLSLFILTTISIGIFHQIEDKYNLFSRNLGYNEIVIQIPECKVDSEKLGNFLHVTRIILKDI